MWKEFFFMPERAVQIATYLHNQGYDVDFVDFSQTDLEDNVHSIDAPRELKGSGWDFKRYGWADTEVDAHLDENVSEYDAFIVDSLTPYFNSGVEHVVDYLDTVVGPKRVALYGEWVGLRPEDFQDHTAVRDNWEMGLEDWLDSGLDNGVHSYGFDEYPMDELPPPDWNEFVDMTDYPEPWCADYRAGRGCPEQCNFCHLAGIYDGTIAGKSADTIISDLDFLITDQGFEKIKLRDDNFCVRGQVAYDVFEWLAENHPDVEILQPEGLEMRTAAHIPEVLEQMGRCNYHSVRVGFETIVEGEFQKNSLDWWEQAHDNFKNAGFEPGEIVCFVMRGHPELKRSDEIDTAIYLSDFDVTLLSGGYRLVPGTELWDNWDGEKQYEYGHGLPQDDEEIERVGRLFRTVSAWNEWGISLFCDKAPFKELEGKSWVENVVDEGDRIVVEGTVSGWTRTDGISYGAEYVLAMRGYYSTNIVHNSKTKMEITGMKGHDPWLHKVAFRAKEQGIEIEEPEGLI
jgi:hypothetical protein